MDVDELKEAWRTGQAVVHGNIEYARVSALIYRKTDRGEIFVQAELLDKGKNSVTIAAPRDVKAREK